MAKRYILEAGTPVMNHMFARIPPERLVVLDVGLAEVVSILVRRRNAGLISAAEFTQLFADFGAEMVDSPDVQILPVGDVTAAFPFIDTRSLNATDAILLRSALDLAGQLRTAG